MLISIKLSTHPADPVCKWLLMKHGRPIHNDLLDLTNKKINIVKVPTRQDIYREPLLLGCDSVIVPLPKEQTSQI